MREKLSGQSLRKLAETCVSILLGNLLLGFTVAAFIVPSGMIMGGATGPVPLSALGYGLAGADF